jgi:hypothetical protein
MWLLLSLLALAGDNSTLKLTNVRTTHGAMGAARSDEKVLPGDQVVLSFDIAGARANSEGKVRYSIAMEVMDDQDRVLFKQEPRDMEAPLGGRDSLPACATLDVGSKQRPGIYTVKVTVKDRTSGETQEVTRKYELLPAGFGLVRYRLSRDPDGKLPVAALRSRRPGWINFSAVGFQRDPATGQPNVAVEMRVLDENGTAIMKPSQGEVKDGIPNGVNSLPMQFEVELPHHRGALTVELTATDKVSGQKATLKAPLNVSAPN